MRPSLEVNTSGHSYPIFIGENILNTLDLSPWLGEQVLVVTDRNVGKRYLTSVLAGCGKRQVDTLIIPAGERSKSSRQLGRIHSQLLAQNYSRDCTLVALGGGVVGDLTGFAAATYLRGVDYIQVPTTLLAQVDSSVGGKTAINHALGKNSIGAFHQPKVVVADTQTLTSLPSRQRSAGLAEVLKCALALDATLLEWLEQHAEALVRGDADITCHAIERSCALKAQVVAQDEREQGVRALLNLGHTFGHAIEAWTTYKGWLHGEAVAVGLVLAADFSMRCGMLSPDEVGRVRDLVKRLGLPVRAPTDMRPEDFLQLMQRDKKNRAGELRLVVLEALGKAKLISNPDLQLLRQSLAG